MKKLSAFLVGASLVASAAVWAANTATSVNAVGFVSMTVPAGKFVLAGIPFNDFDSSLDAVMWGQLTGTDDPSTADRVWLFDSVLQKYVMYWKADGVGGGYDGHMIDPTAKIATNVFLRPGQAFWIQSQATTSQVVVLKGQVPNDTQSTNSVSASFSLVSFPYSASQTIGSISNLLTSGAIGSDDPSTSDTLFLFDVPNQKYERYWLANGVGAPYDGHLIDAGANIATQKWNVGQGAFYQSLGGGFTWVVPRPYPSVSQ
jgi:hypothetical protein